jgi:hypothetical protein
MLDAAEALRLLRLVIEDPSKAPMVEALAVKAGLWSPTRPASATPPASPSSQLAGVLDRVRAATCEAFGLSEDELEAGGGDRARQRGLWWLLTYRHAYTSYPEIASLVGRPAPTVTRCAAQAREALGRDRAFAAKAEEIKAALDLGRAVLAEAAE